MRESWRYMPQIRSKLLQFALHVLPLSIPPFQGGHGRVVTEIVNPRRTTLLIHDAHCQTQAPPGPIKCIARATGLRFGAPQVPNQESLWLHREVLLATQIQVVSELSGDRGRQWHQA